MESDSADWPNIHLYVDGVVWGWAARDDWARSVPEDFYMGSLVRDLPVSSVKCTPVPDCVAMLHNLWEMSSVRTVSQPSFLCTEGNVPGRSKVPR